jgi:hypothetical protein
MADQENAPPMEVGESSEEDEEVLARLLQRRRTGKTRRRAV